MKRTVAFAIGVVTVMLLLAGGVVLAKNIQCGSPTDGPCVGTKKDDNIVGTTGDDEILGRGGRDSLIGDPIGGTGNDVMRGGDGNDDFTDSFASNDVDTIFGGNGNDTINVREGAAFSDNPDVVDCGPRDHDAVIVDPGDTHLNCEIVNP
jgi:Ca2+-binding RTX toxin-like protein